MSAARHPIPRVGLTGGIGSGKSTALAYLHELGAGVISSDDVVHQLYSRPEILAAVEERYGAVVVAGGVIDRGAVARIVFADPAELEWLEALLHPHVRRAIREWVVAQDKTRPRPSLLVAEVPLLFEAGMDSDFDFTILITAPDDLRRRRLSAKLTEAEFKRRLEQQMPEDDKIARCDFVFHNTGSYKELRTFLGEIVAHVLAAAEEAARGPTVDGARG